MFEFRVPGSQGYAWSGELLTIGRDTANGWVLTASGVWARHAQVERGPDGRLTIRSLGDAVVTLNGVPTRESILRWGDSVGLGSVVGRFHLSAPVQRGLRSWEWSLWTLLALCAVFQVALLLWLQR